MADAGQGVPSGLGRERPPATRMWTLMISDQAGNTNSAQGTFVATKSSVSAVRKPAR